MTKFFVICGLAALSVAHGLAVHAEDCSNNGPREFVVKLKLGYLLDEDQRATVLRSFGLDERKTDKPLPHDAVLVTVRDKEDATVKRLTEFGESPLPFEYVEPSLISLRPQSKLLQVPLPDTQWHLAKIDAEGAWRHTRGDPRWIAAVIDMGVDINHPALRGQAGYIGDVHGRDFTDHQLRDDIDDESKAGHGTHVAGIMVGSESPNLHAIAPESRFIVLKIGRQDCIDVPAAIEAIRYAAEQGDVAVANISWSATPLPALREAIVNAPNILFVAAAVDELRSGYTESNDTNSTHPIAWRLPNVIAVTSTTRTDDLASSFGYLVDLAAPGDEILSALPNGRMGVMSGTSMAAPMVAATALLVKSLAPRWTGADLKRYLVDSAARPRELDGYGFGRVDAARATAAPIAIDWPRADSIANSSASVPLKWHALFSSPPCSELDTELSIDGEPYKEVLTRHPIDSNQLDLPIPKIESAKGRVRLSCSGTKLAVESEPFDIIRFP